MGDRNRTDTDGNDEGSEDYVGEPRFRTEFDAGSGRPPSLAVVEAVSAVTGGAPNELPPLHGAVDTDSLDELLSDRSDPSTYVSFRYVGTTVTVRNDGSVLVEDSEPS